VVDAQQELAAENSEVGVSTRGRLHIGMSRLVPENLAAAPILAQEPSGVKPLELTCNTTSRLPQNPESKAPPMVQEAWKLAGLYGLRMDLAALKISHIKSGIEEDSDDSRLQGNKQDNRKEQMPIAPSPDTNASGFELPEASIDKMFQERIAHRPAGGHSAAIEDRLARLRANSLLNALGKEFSVQESVQEAKSSSATAGRPPSSPTPAETRAPYTDAAHLTSFSGFTPWEEDSDQDDVHAET